MMRGEVSPMPLLLLLSLRIKHYFFSPEMKTKEKETLDSSMLLNFLLEEKRKKGA
jgi:hypothetical protein